MLNTIIEPRLKLDSDKDDYGEDPATIRIYS